MRKLSAIILCLLGFKLNLCLKCRPLAKLTARIYDA